MTNDTARRELVQGFFIGLGNAVARYTRLEYEGPESLPEPPALLVANHGFGGVVEGETFESLAARVHGAMSAKLTEMTAGCVPFFGMKWDELLGGKSRRKGN